jgi:hypothetical protein
MKGISAGQCPMCDNGKLNIRVQAWPLEVAYMSVCKMPAAHAAGEHVSCTRAAKETTNDRYILKKSA